MIKDTFLREELAKQSILNYRKSNNIPDNVILNENDFISGIMSEYVDSVNKLELAQNRSEIQDAIKKVNKRIEEEEFIKGLSHTNDRTFIIVKAAEECSELNTALLQSLTKPDQYDPMAILSEIVDVKIQLIALEELLLVEGHLGDDISIIITGQTSKKIEKLKKYKANIKNFGKIL